LSAGTVVWLVTAVGFVVLLALAGAQVLRALRDLRRAKARVAALGDLPVVAALNRTQLDVGRLQAALAQLAPLLLRSQVALAAIRRGPLPPELSAALRSVQAELADLRRVRAG
jgi:hypothetical protein